MAAVVPAETKRSEFRELSVVRDPDGVIAVLTERTRDGRISFAIMREFDNGGETKRTAYLNHHHLAAVRRLLADLEERLQVEEDRTRAKLRDR